MVVVLSVHSSQIIIPFFPTWVAERCFIRKKIVFLHLCYSAEFSYEGFINNFNSVRNLLSNGIIYVLK